MTCRRLKDKKEPAVRKIEEVGLEESRNPSISKGPGTGKAPVV